MKTNFKFYTIVISLILVSNIVLVGCMYSIASDNGDAKAYSTNTQKNNMGESGGNIITEDAPLAQTALQEKFNKYLHKEGNVITVFTEEQYTELKEVRENGNRIPLTYEEILFIINDSISMYLSYDEIILTNANRDNVIPLLSSQSGNARIIHPSHEEYSEYETYSLAKEAYEKMLMDIYEIIYYRIYIHDAGFETIYHTYHNEKEHIFGNRYNGDDGKISSADIMGCYQMLAIDNATYSGIENEEKLAGEYRTLLEWEKMSMMNTITDDYQCPNLNSSVLCTRIVNTLRKPMEYEFYFIDSKDGQQRKIYPTAELEDMMPLRELHYKAKGEDDEWQPGFYLNYKDGTVCLSFSEYTAFDLYGKFEEHDGVLKMHFEGFNLNNSTSNNDSATSPGQGIFGKFDGRDSGFNMYVGGLEKQYCYVFYKHEKGYRYSAFSSKPYSKDDDFANGLVFEKVSERVARERDGMQNSNSK